MTYKQIKNLGEREFKRLCGVKPKLFEEMVKVLKGESSKGKPRGGQAKLSIEDQLLISLEYWREYRTYFHIAQSWGVHESTGEQVNYVRTEVLLGENSIVKIGASMF